MKKYATLILLIMVIISCKATKQKAQTSNIVVYENIFVTKILKSRINCIDRIILNPDSTFKLSFTQGIVALNASGRWYRLKKDSIIFESRNFPIFEKLAYGQQRPDTVEIRKVRVMDGGEKLKFPKRVNNEGKVLEYTIINKKH